MLALVLWLMESSLQLGHSADCRNFSVQAFLLRYRNELLTTGMKATVYQSLPIHLKLKVAFKDGVAVNTNMMSPEQIFIDLSRKQFEADAGTTR